MIKSDLVRRIPEQNPHLYAKDIEIVVNGIFDAGPSPRIAPSRESRRPMRHSLARTLNSLSLEATSLDRILLPNDFGTYSPSKGAAWRRLLLL